MTLAFGLEEAPGQNRLPIYAPNSLEKAFLLNNIANLHKDLGEYSSALDCYFNSLNIRRALLGNKHDKVAQIYQNVGVLYLSENNFDSALIYFQKAIIANTYGFNNIDINPGSNSLYLGIFCGGGNTIVTA